MRKTTFTYAISVMLLASCASVERAIPDGRIPHQLSRPLRGYQWVGKPDGTKQEQAVDIPANWWIASPEIVERSEPTPIPLGLENK